MLYVIDYNGHVKDTEKTIDFHKGHTFFSKRHIYNHNGQKGQQ